DRNRSHWSTSKTPSYTKSVSWQHHPNDVFKRYGRAIRYDFQVDDAKYKCDHLKEIVSTLVGNKINVGHSQKIYKHFKDLEGKIEERLQNRQAEYQNEINQPSAPGVNFDDI
ncbi:hypothetical protein QI029_23740, partial [Escherichia coli]|nr:hypothetical protein [Escherichia coli]